MLVANALRHRGLQLEAGRYKWRSVRNLRAGFNDRAPSRLSIKLLDYPV
jgi:hypothetical protein